MLNGLVRLQGSGPINNLILLVNPNSSKSFTRDTIDSLSSSIPPGLGVDFYTAPETAPASIDGYVHGLLSTAEILKDWGIDQVDSDGAQPFLDWLSETYAVVIVACFSDHPLVHALNEVLESRQKAPKVLGILQTSVSFAASTYRSFGIVTTGHQWERLFDDHVRRSGTQPHQYVGTLGTGFNAASLHGAKPVDVMAEGVKRLGERGATCVILGCAGMGPFKKAVADLASQGLGRKIELLDAVVVTIEYSAMLIRMQ